MAQNELRGKFGAIDRRESTLQNDWRVLSKHDVTRIRLAIETIANPNTKSTLEELESALLCACILATGRPVDEVHKWEMTTAKNSELLLLGDFEGIASAGGGFTFRLKVVPLRAPPLDPSLYLGGLDHLYLDVPVCIIQLWRQCSIHRHIQTEKCVKLFSLPQNDIVAKAKGVILAPTVKGQVPARRSAATIESLQRWLPHRMQALVGGDLSYGAVLSNSYGKATTPEISDQIDTAQSSRTSGSNTGKSVLHYSAISLAKLNHAHGLALEDFKKAPSKIPADIFTNHVGDHWCPKDSAIKSSIQQIVAVLEDLSSPLEERHRAMSLYTLIMHSFGTGHRNVPSAMVGLLQIDDETGYAQLSDKHTKSAPNAGRRTVWFPRPVRHQLQLFEIHLDKLEGELDDNTRATVRELRAKYEGRLCLFDFSEQRVKSVTPAELFKLGRKWDWQFQRNAGRHWLRSGLIGHCSSETITAQLGHAVAGLEGWATSSALDPWIVREELSRAIEKRLKAVDLTPRTSRNVSHPVFKRQPCPFGQYILNSDIRNETPAQIHGHLLASAVYFGGFLNSEKWSFFTDALDKNIIYDGDHFWVELGDDAHGSGHRWRADPVTANLIVQAHKIGVIIANVRHARQSNTSHMDSASCLEKYFSPTYTFEQFRDAAISRWKFRLPPILFSHATGASQVRALGTWRYWTMRTCSVDAHNDEHRSEEVVETRTVPFKRVFNPFVIDKIIAILKAAPPVNNSRGYYIKYTTKTKIDDEVRKLNEKYNICIRDIRIKEWICDSLIVKRAGRNHKGFAPSTLYYYLNNLRKTILLDLPMNIDPSSIKYKNICDIISNKIDNIQFNDNNKYISTYNHFLRYFANECNNYNIIASILNEFRDATFSRPDTISSPDFKRALSISENQESHNRSIKLALILGYRLGLRVDEVANLRIRNVLLDASEPDMLVIDHSKERLLKRFQSRRLVPLTGILETGEIRLLSSLSANRRSQKGFLLDLGTNKIRDRIRVLNKTCSQILTEACSSQRMEFRHLRHSFATNQITELLRPQRLSENPRFDPSIKPTDYQSSIERHSPFVYGSGHMSREALVGPQRPGRSDLHSLAMTMGHATVETSLQYYIHDLDTPLAEHIARPLNAAILSYAQCGRLLRLTSDAARISHTRWKHNLNSETTWEIANFPNLDGGVTTLWHQPKTLIDKWCKRNIHSDLAPNIETHGLNGRL